MIFKRKARIGVSACLLGRRVRYDGGHSLDRFIRDTLSRFADFVPVCPEEECGLPVPREPMNLERDPTSPRLITVHTRQDFTDKLMIWAEQRAGQLQFENISGFIFKSKSPSCGLKGVKIYDHDRGVSRQGAGLFVRVLMEHFPLLPVVDSDCFHSGAVRLNFLIRVLLFTCRRALIQQPHGDAAGGGKTFADL